MMTQTVTTPSGTNVPFSLKVRLQTLALSIISAINEYKKNRSNLSDNRERNIAYLLAIVEIASTNPTESNFKTPDALASMIHEYLTSECFVTGFFNGSSLRDRIFALIEKDYPLILLKLIMIKNIIFSCAVI